MGPPLEYNDYRDYMEQKNSYANIPSVLKITAKTTFEMVLFASLYLLGDVYMPLSKLRTD
jgi:hypothetical protein